MSELDILDRLADVLAKAMRPTGVPLDMQLWDVDTIGEWMGLSADTVSKNVVTRPAFPVPIQPTASRHAQKRWFAGEVIAWARQNRGVLPKGRGRPRAVA